MRTKFKCAQMNLRSRKGKTTWRHDIRRYWLQKPNLCKSKTTKWTRPKKSWRHEWTSDLSCVRSSTTKSCRDIRTSKRRLKASKRSKRTSRNASTLHVQVRPAAARCQQLSLRWEGHATARLTCPRASERRTCGRNFYACRKDTLKQLVEPAAERLESR